MQHSDTTSLHGPGALGERRVTPAVVVDELTIRFGDTLACEGICFRVVSGSSLAIVGASGSGKTSLLLALAGLLRPSQGQVWVDGTSLWGASRRQRAEIRRRSLGYVAQFGDVVPELTLIENVALPLRLLGRPASDAYQTAANRMRQLGVGHLGRRFPDEVSGGEQQRCALARALAHDPSVILADEPTAALDEDNRLLVTSQLLAAAKITGCAVIMVTHDMTLASTADHRMQMSEGRLQKLPPWP